MTLFFGGIYTSPPQGHTSLTYNKKTLRLSAFFSSFVELCRGYVAWLRRLQSVLISGEKWAFYQLNDRVK